MLGDLALLVEPDEVDGVHREGLAGGGRAGDVADNRRARAVADVAAAALLSLTSPGSSGQARGFWIHLDADFINPTVMPAVDSPTPGGPTIKELVELLTPFVRHPRALGLELTIYDPGLDPDRSCAARLVTLLENLLLGSSLLDQRSHR